jgi:hypothetical protein
MVPPFCSPSRRLPPRHKPAKEGRYTVVAMARHATKVMSMKSRPLFFSIKSKTKKEHIHQIENTKECVDHDKIRTQIDGFHSNNMFLTHRSKNIGLEAVSCLVETPVVTRTILWWNVLQN